MKKSLYDSQVYQECVDRINIITEDTKPIWGSMDDAQMMSHCAEVQAVMNGKPLVGTPFIIKLFKGFVKKMVINEVPYRKHTKTHPQYFQRSDKDFSTEKRRLLIELDKFVNMDKQTAIGIKHSLFGTMTLEERGWSTYKHLNHHLMQFGV